jgi:uncharacterized protein YndB with AHSA1/START domain
VAEVERIIDAPVDRVWAALADGWSYSNWVVGAAHVRQVDDDWPGEGTRLHHSSGMWPLLVSDVTVVRRSEPPHLLEMQPHLWPLGRGVVVLRLTSLGPERTRVRIEERFDRGPLRWALVKANDLLLHRRNAESLRRLSHLATRRHVS